MGNPSGSRSGEYGIAVGSQRQHESRISKRILLIRYSEGPQAAQSHMKEMKMSLKTALAFFQGLFLDDGTGSEVPY